MVAYNTNDQDAVFKALSHHGRRLLLDRLAKSNGMSLNQLCSTMSMTRQAVSKHLKILEEADLVGTIWKGREKLHFLNAAPIRAIYNRWIKKYQGHYIGNVEWLKNKLEHIKIEKGR